MLLVLVQCFAMRLKTKDLQHVCAQVVEQVQGYASEKILRTALAIRLREQGYICHEEVVLPVVSNGYFVGHNRIDILVHRTHGATGKAYYVAAIELKTLRESLHCRERAHEVEQQTRGYMRCLRSVFANSRVFHVFTVNFRRAEPDVEVLELEEKRPIKT